MEYSDSKGIYLVLFWVLSFFVLSFNGVGYIGIDRFLHRGELLIVINLIN